MKRKILILIIYFSIFPFFAFVPISGIFAKNDIVISEISWMGSLNSSSDEWIEIFNNTDKEIILKGWKVASSDGSPEINLTGSIAPLGFFLLERTDDNSSPALADQLYTGALGNKGEHLKIINSEGVLTDEVNCLSGWFGGDNESKKTMERVNMEISGNEVSNWQTSENAGGSPKAKNSTPSVIPTSPVIPVKTGIQDVKIEEIDFHLQISKLLPAPEGADTENEYIEIFNKDAKDINISGWKLRDKIGSAVEYVIPKNTKILANGYLVFKRTETKIVLNNDKDTIELLNSKNKLVDSVSYEKAPANEIYKKTGEGWQWGDKIKKPNINKNTANLLNSAPKINPEPQQKLTLYSAASALSIFSGIAILLVKKFILY